MGGIRNDIKLPYSYDFWAAILALDVSGFTKITEAASSRGHYGVELITNVLNRYFGEIYQLIHPLGGDIAKFGGDACLILIPPTPEGQMPDMPGLARSILDMTARLNELFLREYGFPFQIHGAWGAGMVSLNVVGSTRRHLDYYVISEAIKEVYTLCDSAEHAEILEAKDIPPPPSECYWCHMPKGRKNVAPMYFPADIIRKLSEEPHPAELRNAAVLFIKLSPSQGEEITVEDFHQAYTAIQNVVTRNLGLINKIDFNEKGYLFLITFGVPYVYGNDSLRAFMAAYWISQSQLKGSYVQIGITYSNFYFGIIGAPQRHEYGIIGNAVNIAARLMSYARPGEICLSEELLPQLEGQFDTAYLDTAPVKGIARPIRIYRLMRMLPSRWGRLEAQYRVGPLFVDPVFTTRLEQGLASDMGFLAVLNGGAGTGKSRLAFKLSEPYFNQQPPFQFIQAGPHFRSQRLELFFYSLRQELGINHLSEEWNQVKSWSESKGLVLDDKALQDLIFGAPNTPQRIQLAIDQMLDMLVCFYPKGRMLVLENFHNFDPQSQNLLIRLIQHKVYEGDKVIVSTQESLPAALDLGVQSFEVNLDNWSEEISTHYIKLHIKNITKPAIRLLHQISRGNPRFLRELLSHIQKHWHWEQDLISDQIIEDMRARGLLPKDLENLLRADYEALKPADQLFVRLACIFGRPLKLSDLEKVFPSQNIAELRGSAESLLASGILRYESGLEMQTLNFVNPLFPETVYRSILMSEKIALHRSIADYYSSLNSDEEQTWELIAHHWLKTGDREKIALWCGKLAGHYEHSGAFELSLRMWEQIAHTPLNEEAGIQAELKTAQLHLLLGNNDHAEGILKNHENLAEKTGELHDTWIYLWTRLLVNRAAYSQLEAFLANPQAQMQDASLQDKINIAHGEAILQSMNAEAVASTVLPLWEKFKAAKDRQSLNILSGIIGNYYINSGDYKQAAVYYREKIALSKSLKDPVSIRIGYSGLGIAHSRMGNKKKAIYYYQEALEIASRTGDRNGYSKSLLDLGTYHRNLGDLEKALDYYLQSLSLAEYIGNKLQISIVIYDIGELYYYQEKLDEAEDYITRSLKMADEIGDEAGKSFCYDALGDINYKRQNYEKAHQIYRANLILQHKLKDMEGKAHSLGNLGNIAKAKKRYDHAAKFYHAQIDILSEVGDIDGTGRAWFNLAMLDIEQDDKPASLTKLQKALELFESCNAQYYIDITRQMME